MAWVGIAHRRYPPSVRPMHQPVIKLAPDRAARRFIRAANLPRDHQHDTGALGKRILNPPRQVRMGRGNAVAMKINDDVRVDPPVPEGPVPTSIERARRRRH